MDGGQYVYGGTTPGDRVLHVRSSPFDSDVVHIVSSATISAAEAADSAPYLTDFGELRRSGDLSELADRPDRHYDGASAENYVAAIERSAGTVPTTDELNARLKAVEDVDFGGDDDFPSDDTDFRPEWEADEAPAEEWRGYSVIANAMSDDLPADIFKEFAIDSYGDSPGFSGKIDSHVDVDRLEPMIAALEARGYVVIRD
jgi:hypothetical protein